MLIPIIAFSQSSYDDYMAKTPSFNISLSAAKRVKNNFPYSRITFLDARADTSALGFYTIYADSFSRYTFKNGFVNELEKYFSNNFNLSVDNNDSTGLLVAIKKFWISNHAKDSTSFPKKEDKRIMMLDAEIYKHDANGYAAFFKTDTIFENINSVAKAADICTSALSSLLKKCIDLRTQVSLKTKRNFSLNEIKEHLDNRFAIPALKDTGKLTGIYYTFSDFKNNKPVLQKFIPGESGAFDEVFVIDDKGEKTLIRNFWGLCNGKDAFVNYHKNLFPIIRSGNAFYISTKSENATNPWNDFLKGLADAAITAAISRYTGEYLHLIYYDKKFKEQIPDYPLLLDWDTGMFY